MNIEARDPSIAMCFPARPRCLEETVAALENLRLDLLRLHAGVGSPDDLTAALEKGREMGDAIDAELAGRSAVRMLLGGGSGGTRTDLGRRLGR